MYASLPAPAPRRQQIYSTSPDKEKQNVKSYSAYSGVSDNVADIAQEVIRQNAPLPETVKTLPHKADNSERLGPRPRPLSDYVSRPPSALPMEAKVSFDQKEQHVIGKQVNVAGNINHIPYIADNPKQPNFIQGLINKYVLPSPPPLSAKAKVLIDQKGQQVTNQVNVAGNINHTYFYKTINFTHTKDIAELAKGLRAIRRELGKLPKYRFVIPSVDRDISTQLEKAINAIGSARPNMRVATRNIGRTRAVIQKEIVREVATIAEQFAEISQEASTLPPSERITLQNLEGPIKGLQEIMSECTKAWGNDAVELREVTEKLNTAIQEPQKLLSKRPAKIRNQNIARKPVRGRVSLLGALILGVVGLVGMWTDLGMASGILVTLMSPLLIKKEEAA